MAIAEKVVVKHDPSITARGARFRHVVRVEVHLRDGTRHDEMVEAPRGSENKFASESDVVEKFRKLTRDALPAAQATRIADMVLGCDKLDDLGLLAKALATS
jgi:2-methylcitrate dehydratase PrpD